MLNQPLSKTSASTQNIDQDNTSSLQYTSKEDFAIHLKNRYLTTKYNLPKIFYDKSKPLLEITFKGDEHNRHVRIKNTCYDRFTFSISSGVYLYTLTDEEQLKEIFERYKIDADKLHLECLKEQISALDKELPGNDQIRDEFCRLQGIAFQRDTKVSEFTHLYQTYFIPIPNPGDEISLHLIQVLYSDPQIKNITENNAENFILREIVVLLIAELLENKTNTKRNEWRQSAYRNLKRILEINGCSKEPYSEWPEIKIPEINNDSIPQDFSPQTDISDAEIKDFLQKTYLSNISSDALAYALINLNQQIKPKIPYTASSNTIAIKPQKNYPSKKISENNVPEPKNTFLDILSKSFGSFLNIVSYQTQNNSLTLKKILEKNIQSHCKTTTTPITILSQHGLAIQCDSIENIHLVFTAYYQDFHLTKDNTKNNQYLMPNHHWVKHFLTVINSLNAEDYYKNHFEGTPQRSLEECLKLSPEPETSCLVM